MSYKSREGGMTVCVMNVHLRHTHISLLAEAGVDLNYIMNRVGHKNSETTTQIYLHVTSGMRNNASQKMHAKFTELLKE